MMRTKIVLFLVCLFVLATNVVAAPTTTRLGQYTAQATVDWRLAPGPHCLQFRWNGSGLNPSFYVYGYPKFVDPSVKEYELRGAVTGLTPGGLWRVALGDNWFPIDVYQEISLGTNHVTVYWKVNPETGYMEVHSQEGLLPCVAGFRTFLMEIGK